MKRKKITILVVTLLLSLVLTGLSVSAAPVVIFSSPNSGDSIESLPSAGVVAKYLVVAFRQGGSDAFAISSSNELGADRSFLSGTDPNTYSVFAERWDAAGADTNYDNQPSDEEPDSLQQSNGGHETPPGSAPVFQGIDWSGNIALTSSSGTFEMQDIQVYADLGVQASNNNPVQSVSNSDYFPNGETSANDGATPGNEDNGDLDDPGAPGTDSGAHSNDGLQGSVDHAQLLTDLEGWRTYIQNLDEGGQALCTITSDIENENAKDGSGPLEVNYDSCDKNGDGVAVIDIERGGSDFNVNNSDWIIEGSGDVLFIFRIRGGSNMLMSNAAILLGDGGIGGGSASTPVSKLGAIFVKAHPDEEGNGSSDQVFNGDNVILNGIGLWDLVEVGTENSGDTELIINNGQGCAQFISNKVNFQNVRWNRCDTPAITQTKVAIGNLVWSDADDSGTQNGVEHGIDGISVRLLRDSNGNGECEADVDQVVGSDLITAGGGFYQFLGVDASTLGDATTYYCVAVDTVGLKAMGYTSSSTGGDHAPDDTGDHPVSNGDDGVVSGDWIVSRPFVATVLGQTSDDAGDPAGYPDSSSYMTVDFGVISGGSATAVTLNGMQANGSGPNLALVFVGLLVLITGMAGLAFGLKHA